MSQPVFKYRGLPVKRVLPVNSPVIQTEAEASVTPETFPVVEPVTTEEAKVGRKPKSTPFAEGETQE